MGFESYKDKAKGTFGQTSTINDDELQLRFRQPRDFKEGDDSKGRMIIRIGKGLLKKAKINIKDGIDVLFDAENNKALIKKADDGWKVCNGGKSGCGGVDIPWGQDRFFDFTKLKYTAIEHKVTKEGIVFDAPQTA